MTGVFDIGARHDHAIVGQHGCANVNLGIFEFCLLVFGKHAELKPQIRFGTTGSLDKRIGTNVDKKFLFAVGLFLFGNLRKLGSPILESHF